MIKYIEECYENDIEYFKLLINTKELFLDKLKEFLNKDLKGFFEKKKFVRLFYKFSYYTNGCSNLVNASI